ncbi:penicillin-binding transpeptidase domain-containing protein [Nesterenkonia flava]|uniref:Penicillin-binding transpeptidase domain-containing protein n=1 Tax=Nesterenkonia flava TaxID=469799 RepID=A0ABU1FTC2_9MICC|nr:penicillin-binding transpeptidase domain-containing protein [Nesterenkonia flava]MDR5711905.1 penicillin-binding transpeptidase domain-containing protein [Nesterenkonia flava]
MPVSTRRRRALLFSAPAALSVLLLTSCGGEEERASAEDAAEALAQALITGDFSEVRFSTSSAEILGAAAENLHEPFAELGEEGISPEVTVAELVVNEPAEDSVRPPTAEVTFDHVWDLEELGLEEDWSYQTAADFTYYEESDLWLLDGETSVILPDYAGHENIGLITTSADRGRIMDGNGRAMVYNRDVVRIGLDKTQLEGEEAQRAAARQLAEAVDIDPDTYEEKVLAYGEEAWVDAITVRAHSTAITVDDVEDLPGVHLQYDQMPLAERADFAPRLLGRVDPVTAEHLEADPGLSVGDLVGTSGIQAVHEQTLRGTPGVRIHMDGEPLFETEPETGQDIHTALNPRLQDLAQSIVDEQEVTAGIVAIRPSDGGILAAASHTTESEYVDASISTTYAPGSTFKMVSALAMLRDGLTPSSQVSCPHSTTVHGQIFRNVPGYPGEFIGTHSFAELMAVSCNTLFADAHDDVTSGELYQAALDLGLNEEIGIGLHARKGSVPQEAELNLHAANLFGQGVVETSVLGMATVAASIAAGETVHPRLVTLEEEPEWAGEGDLTTEEAEQLMELMEGTVDFGTLQHMDHVPGEHVYAKTGTAEAGDGDDTYAHTWVIAVQGDLAVAIFLEEGEFGGSTNGPLLHQFLTGAQDILN